MKPLLSELFLPCSGMHSPIRANRYPLATITGAQRASGQTHSRARSHQDDADLRADRSTAYLVSCIRVRSAHGNFLETGFGASCGSSDFNMITEISDAVGESGRGLGRITASEVFGAEVLVASTITQHVIDGCQDRRGNRDRCLLGAVARFETEELGLEIAVLLARCAPRSLHQYRLEPGCSLPNPR